MALEMLAALEGLHDERLKMSLWSVTAVSHRMLGPMIRLEFPGRVSFDLTGQEAALLARALAGVREGKSAVEEVYMSPIASNGDFSGKVGADGLSVAASEPITLAWDEVGKMAAALAALATPAAPNVDAAL